MQIIIVRDLVTGETVALAINGSRTDLPIGGDHYHIRTGTPPLLMELIVVSLRVVSVKRIPRSFCYNLKAPPCHRVFAWMDDQEED